MLRRDWKWWMMDAKKCGGNNFEWLSRHGFNVKTLCGTKTSVNRLLSKLLRPQSDWIQGMLLVGSREFLITTMEFYHTYLRLRLFYVGMSVENFRAKLSATATYIETKLQALFGLALSKQGWPLWIFTYMI